MASAPRRLGVRGMHGASCPSLLRGIALTMQRNGTVCPDPRTPVVARCLVHHVPSLPSCCCCSSMLLPPHCSFLMLRSTLLPAAAANATAAAAAPLWPQVGLVFHDVIAAAEAVNCQELQLQVRQRGAYGVNA